MFIIIFGGLFDGWIQVFSSELLRYDIFAQDLDEIIKSQQTVTVEDFT